MTKTIKYSTMESVKHFMDKYGNLLDCGGYDKIREELQSVSPELLVRHDRIVQMQKDLIDQQTLFELDLNDLGTTDG